MKVWEVQSHWGIDALTAIDRAAPVPGSGEIVVRMRAASVNYRDLLTVQGQGVGNELPLVPFSDGAGEVLEVDTGVTRVAPGDRVCPMFFPSWIDGGPTAEKRSDPLGGPRPGVLQEEMVLDAEAVAPVPEHLSMIEAATLPCAALTAWRALVVEGGLQADETVLLQGTGGVATFALQFAKALGARVIVISSSDEKLEQARGRGADHLINYRTTPEWQDAALEVTGGAGVDHILELGGRETINRSLQAARVGGKVLIIGVLSGFSQEIAMRSIYGKNLRLIGLSVGSRAHFEAMTAFVERHRIHPVIDTVLPFDSVPAALLRMQSARHIGKICLDFTI
ncbi:NAD(P)-dependent alcohol dehydrogenase [Aquisalimonas lutea]|uniref:zinc-dependent alcohol dehydrogenase family protein n=1 Tax=Aquisalimonas lutea TaxID=1327750 RepID=UPI0025B5960C|nr:NAD(P)-dependent alcohol dehydrogenase [Aquisalimonas lutea]MDN3517227.1 NAD(P)-dependent alcohol dehydrogenase [Aquisalimonas lutea]